MSKKSYRQFQRADFAFGYFDGSGVHWMLPDAIGSIELVVSGAGHVEQHTGYYPYGQPWRAVAGQQRLFGGKELRTFAALNDYDFHARRQNPAGPFFESADRHAGNDPARSPWTFAAANPVRFADPSGLDIYEFDKEARFVKCTPSEKDYVSIGEAKTTGFHKGTIEKQYQIKVPGDKFDYLVVRGDDEAKEIFEFLADNSNVEVSRLSCGEEGENGLNYISSSHEKGGDRSSNWLVGNQLGYGYTVNEFIHNHPSGCLAPSEEDKMMLKKWEIRYGIMPKAKIYTAQKYKGIGNYVKYNKNTVKISAEEFYKNNEVENEK